MNKKEVTPWRYWFFFASLYFVYQIIKDYKFLPSPGLLSIMKIKQMIENKQFDFIIDVRTSSEYEKGHYENAINIPFSEISDTDLSVFHNRTILLYCETGRRAKLAWNEFREEIKYVYYTDKTYDELSS